MAQWAALEEDERQQGSGATNTPIPENLMSSNSVVPHPLMDCGQAEISNNCNNGPTTGQGSDKGSSDVESGQDGERVGRASEGDEDATGRSVDDVPMAIDGVNYPIDGAPHPINNRDRIHPSNTSLQPNGIRLRKYESIPPPHGATPPSGGQQSIRLCKCE